MERYRFCCSSGSTLLRRETNIEERVVESASHAKAAYDFSRMYLPNWSEDCTAQRKVTETASGNRGATKRKNQRLAVELSRLRFDDSGYLERGPDYPNLRFVRKLCFLFGRFSLVLVLTVDLRRYLRFEPVFELGCRQTRCKGRPELPPQEFVVLC